MCIGRRVKHPLFLSDLNENWIFSTDFRKMFKYVITENPSSVSRVVPCRRTDKQTERQTVYDGAKSHFSQICEHAYEHCTIIHMFPKLSETSSDYFLQTLFKIRLYSRGKYIFWETETEYLQLRFISIFKMLVCHYLWQDIEIYRSWPFCTKGSREWLWNEREHCVYSWINTNISEESVEGIGMQRSAHRGTWSRKHRGLRSYPVFLIIYIASYYIKTAVLSWQLCLYRWISTSFQYRGHVYCQSVLLMCRTLLE
jgi:hypothetical protein